MSKADIKITKIETALASDVMPGLLLLRIHTDAGIVGCGETYYTPQAVASMIHDWMARRLLGADALAVEAHWRWLYERSTNFGSRGCELRAISALDLALWDILGQVCEQPVWQVLGGRVQERVRVYNSSGGPAYGAPRQDQLGSQGWPGYGRIGNEGPLNDYWAVVNKPVDYAQELIDAGYRGLKMWTLDFAGHKPRGGLYITPEDVDEALRPMRQIREALGGRIEMMMDGHGFFQLAPALRIARAMRDLDPLWLEDVIRPDAIDTIADFRDKAGVPIAVSEMMIGPDDYRLVLDKRAADYIMIDPTWVGGISQTRRLAQQAQFYNIPVVMHDCTGPLTMISGVQIATSTANVAWQETVRAHIAFFYPKLINQTVTIEDGHITAPTEPGLGLSWREDRFTAAYGLRVSAAG